MQWLIYPVAGLVLLLVAMQFMALRQARRSEGRPAPDTASVDGEAGIDVRRVYYFHALHCGPCRAMTPLVDRIGASHRNLVKVDVAQRPDLARGFGIAATPSFVRVDNGVIRQVRLGGQSEKQLLNLLQGD